MILPIKLYGSSILRKKSINAIPEDITSQLISDMFETLSKHRGIGLAAPQIGRLQRIFIIDTHALEGLNTKIRKAYINPEILDFSDETCFYTEGCLNLKFQQEDSRSPTMSDV